MSLELACLTVGLMGFLVVFYQVITGYVVITGILPDYYPLHASPTPPQPHNWLTFDFFFGKRGTPFFAYRPPRSSYRRRRVESKGSAGIHV